MKDKVFFHKQGKERDLTVLALIYFIGTERIQSAMKHIKRLRIF